MHTRFVSFFLKYNFSKDILEVLLQISVTFRFLLFSETRLHRCSIEDQLIWWPRISSEYKIQFSSCTLLLRWSIESTAYLSWVELRCSRFTQHSPEVSKGRKMRYQEHDQFIGSPEEKFCRKQTIAYLCCARILLHRHDHLRPSICPPIGCFSSILIKRWGNSASFSLPVESQVQVLNKRLIDMRVYW